MDLEQEEEDVYSLRELLQEVCLDNQFTAEQTGKQLSLVDGEGHGTGRLVLVMKPMPTRVTADWMAQQWRDGRRN